jgi:hypothetical protein
MLNKTCLSMFQTEQGRAEIMSISLLTHVTLPIEAGFAY